MTTRNKLRVMNHKATPFLRRPGHNNGKSLEIFNRCPWDAWWYEFITSRQKTGRMTYLTAWQFAKAKAKTDLELDVIYRAIGPKPISFEQLDEKDKRYPGRKVPHLGNWQQIRAKAYFYDNTSIEKLKQITSERLDALEAGRAASTIVLDLIAKWAKYDDRIDEFYHRGPVQEGLSKTAQKDLAKDFFYLKNQTTRGILELLDKYLACYGISNNGLNDLGQLIMAAGGSAARSALSGVATGAVLAQPESPALQALSKAIFERANIFRMPLPAAVVAEREEDGEEEKL